MKFRELLRPDWQTAVIVVAILSILGDIAYSIFVHPTTEEDESAPGMPPPIVAQQSGEIVERFGDPADANGGIVRMPVAMANDPNTVTVPRRPLTPEKARVAAMQSMQHIDYETLHTMQVQILDEMRDRIREQGVGPDGVTIADIDRMQKNGQIPQ